MLESAQQISPPRELWPFGVTEVVDPQTRQKLPALLIGDLTPGEKYLITEIISGRQFGIQFHGPSLNCPGRIDFTRLDEKGEPVVDLHRFSESLQDYGSKYCSASLATLGLVPLENGQYSSVYVTSFPQAA